MINMVLRGYPNHIYNDDFMLEYIPDLSNELISKVFPTPEIIHVTTPKTKGFFNACEDD